ncbi:diaminopimelate decarboxylase [Archangium lansingense]|uniref:Diaminopimelate decarboxylase n=1 Tax=Archangium lansingense TaxID=2995310 RepID=A0ABT4ACS7_9BACT|nr:diaminopimelate decarboxylase [Archangium lansinium]MCY1079435.1 diaminopimelate decarboxylase [Archangium lansinium]
MPIQPTFARRLEPIMMELVEQYGTPFHIYDLAGIVATHRSMVQAFGDWPFRQYFAVKALPNPAVLRALVQAGSGLDCSSPVELQLAQASGAVGDAIVFTSNNTTLEEYEQALGAGALITFDDERYLRRAEPLPPVIAFRVAPNGGAARSTLMGVAGESKFGVPRPVLADAYMEAHRRGAERFGIHGMSCANELDVSNAVRAAEELVETAVQIERAVGIQFEYINFGGGSGIPYRLEDQPFDFRAYASAIRAALAKAFPGRRPRVLMECGRFVSGPHGILVARVINRVKKERAVVGLDASMSALMRPGFYRTAYHHVSLPFAGPRPEVSVDVVGSLCENIDRFAVDRRLPDPAEGDIVYIHDTGAHGHAMGFTYNGRLRPAELLLTEAGDVLEIRRAETFEDYVTTVRWEPIPLRVGMSEETESA